MPFDFDSEELLSSEALCKSYGQTKALDQLSLNIRRGEILGLLGPNGAGKTTAIHIFLGLLAPSTGKVSVLGCNPIKDQNRIAGKINFSSAYVSLPTNLTVAENLYIYSKIYNVANWQSKSDELLELLGIVHLKKRVTGALSSGERTRLNLVKCLLNDPILLLLDEPTASLDPEMADKVRSILKTVQQRNNMGILYTSHNMPEVEALCHRVLFIHQGKTIASGTPEEVLKKFQSQNLDQVFIKIVRSGDVVGGES